MRPELDAPDKAQLRSAAASLGLDWNRAMHGSVETAYQRYYDVTEEEVDQWPKMVFGPVPDWLELRRRGFLEGSVDDIRPAG